VSEASDRLDILQGTLELVILRVMRWGPQHGHGIATAIRRSSSDAIRIEGGSLYPALQRLVQERWVESSWGVSTNNRRARFYKLTPAGRRQLVAQESSWARLVRAMQLIGRKPVED
jgi:PadR family transcriptional regulator, regulatory protein PadR